MGVASSQVVAVDPAVAVDPVAVDPGALRSDERRFSGLRILCLHGHGSNNDITDIQLQGLALQARHGVSCDLLEAHLDSTAQTPTLELFSERPFRTWFRWYLPTGGPFATSTLDDSLDRIMEVVDSNGPYDGVYGFSQGAFVCTALCNPTVWRDRFGRTQCPFQFAILANSGMSDRLTTCQIASAPATKPMRKKLEFPVAIPSLHLVGAKDWYKEGQVRHASLFEAAMIYEHANGHEIPLRLAQDNDLASAIAEFLRPFRDERF